MTNMVYEFPELQGIMGCYYAKHDGESDEVATAITEHYQPRFAQDDLPSSSVGLCIALADRIDTLVGLFGIGKIPTGDKDPFALRRQALAVLRILIEKRIKLDLQELFKESLETYQIQLKNPTEALLDFCFDRLRAWYSSQSIPSKTFEAVLANRPTTPFDFHCRLEAVKTFQALPEAESLAAANKRVHKLLEKSANEQQTSELATIQESLLQESAEKALLSLLEIKESEVAPLLEQADYSQTLKTLANLKEPVDTFFNEVMVMVDDNAVRTNRLQLLYRLRSLFLQVADVSLL